MLSEFLEQNSRSRIAILIHNIVVSLAKLIDDRFEQMLMIAHIRLSIPISKTYIYYFCGTVIIVSAGIGNSGSIRCILCNSCILSVRHIEIYIPNVYHHFLEINALWFYRYLFVITRLLKFLLLKIALTSFVHKKKSEAILCNTICFDTKLNCQLQIESK